MFNEKLIFEDLPGRPSSHCATVTELPGGDLLAAWYSGTREGAPDVGILAARYSAGTWSTPIVLVDTPGLSDGNPTLFTAPDGSVILFYVTIQGRGWSSVLPFWKRSTDGARSWSSPKPFSDRRGLMFRSRPLVCSSGRIVLPAYDEITWRGLCLISDDGGQSWRTGGEIVGPDLCIQPAFLERPDGSLFAYLRSGGVHHYLWQSWSVDGGESWAPACSSEFPNPDSGLDLIRSQCGRWVLVCNPLYWQRHHLSLAISDNNAATWWQIALECEPGAEFSYPQLLETRTGECHLLYTYKRRSIKHMSFRVADLAADDGLQSSDSRRHLT